jgi:hypothetical protein
VTTISPSSLEDLPKLSASCTLAHDTDSALALALAALEQLQATHAARLGLYAHAERVAEAVRATEAAEEAMGANCGSVSASKAVLGADGDPTEHALHEAAHALHVAVERARAAVVDCTAAGLLDAAEKRLRQCAEGGATDESETLSAQLEVERARAVLEHGRAQGKVRVRKEFVCELVRCVEMSILCACNADAA